MDRAAPLSLTRCSANPVDRFAEPGSGAPVLLDLPLRGARSTVLRASLGRASPCPGCSRSRGPRRCRHETRARRAGRESRSHTDAGVRRGQQPLLSRWTSLPSGPAGSVFWSVQWCSEGDRGTCVPRPGNTMVRGCHGTDAAAGSSASGCARLRPGHPAGASGNPHRVGASLVGAARPAPGHRRRPWGSMPSAVRAPTESFRSAIWPAPRATTPGTRTGWRSAASTPAARSASRWRCFRRIRGPRAHAQLIGGEVTLLPADDHAATLKLMRDARPRADEHDTRRLRLRLPHRASRSARTADRRFDRLSFAGHFDMLMFGRRGIERPPDEASLNPYRKRVRRHVRAARSASTACGTSWRTT